MVIIGHGLLCPNTLTYMHTHTHTHTPTESHTHTYLEQVSGDNAEPLGVVSYSLQVGIHTEDHLEYIQEESQRVLVQEVHLARGEEGHWGKYMYLGQYS